jgi:hypothetical protein
MALSAEAQPIQPLDLAKVSSREAGSPYIRQGTCLVFRYQQDVYCLSSYHVAYSALREGYEHWVNFTNGDRAALEWFASDWGRGVILLRLVDPPRREYLPWENIPWGKREADPKGEAVTALGFPLNSFSLNEATGERLEDSGLEISLFVYIDSLVRVADLASELGFSGGALIDEGGTYIGLLSHQMNFDGQLLTVAIPAFEARDWAKRHLETQQNRSFFYVEPEELEASRYSLYIRNLKIDVEESGDEAAEITFNSGAHEFESIILENWGMIRAPPYFPGGPFKLVGCTPYWPVLGVDEIGLFRRGVEPIRYLFRSDLFSDFCGYYQFLRPGADERELVKEWKNLRSAWREAKAAMDLSEAPEWAELWASVMNLGEEKRKDGFSLRGGNLPAFLRPYYFSKLRENSDTGRLLLQKKYPVQMRKLERALDKMIALHSREVLTIAAPEFKHKAER